MLIVNNEQFVIETGTMLSGSVLLNDTSDGSPVSSVPGVMVELLTLEFSGDFVLNEDGTFTFDPMGTLGDNSFDYRVTLGAESQVGTVTITVNEPNLPPVTEDDLTTITERSTSAALSLFVTADDTDPDGDDALLTVVSVAGQTTAPINLSLGTVTSFSGGTIVYAPTPNTNGVETFQYTVQDEGGATSTATVQITIEPNQPPSITQTDFAAVAEGDVGVLSNVTFDPATLLSVVASDPDSFDTPAIVSGSLVVTVETPGSDFPSAGNFLTGATATTVDTANYDALGAGEQGLFRLSYDIESGADVVSTFSLITISGVNDAPIATDDAASTPEDTTLADDVSENDSDVDSANLTYSVQADVSNGTLLLNSDGSYTYTPDPEFSGADAFTYIVSDGALTDTGTVSITVVPVDDAPVATDDAFSTAEDTPLVADVSGNDGDADSATLTYTVQTDVSNGTLVLNNDGSFNYTPSPDFAGSDQFTYLVSDGASNDVATVEITVTPTNDAPIATDDAFSTGEDTSLSDDVSVNDSDVDNATLAYALLTNVSNGMLSFNEDGSFTYTPTADFTGSDQFTYSADDGAATDTATVTIAVTPQNDPPVAVDDVAATAEDMSTTINVLSNDTDPDLDDPTLVSVSGPANGSAELTPTGDVSFGVLYTPDAEFFGTDSFTYEIRDTNGATDTATVTVTVTAVNDAPDAMDDAFATVENVALSDDVSVNDSDIDSVALAYALVTNVANGLLSFNTDGSFTYTPTSNFSGFDQFTYSVNDGALSDTATAMIAIAAAANVPPMAVDDTAVTDEDTPITIDVLNNDTDADLEDPTLVSVSDPANGSTELTPTGDVSFGVLYTPNPDFAGTDSFTYEIRDTDGATDTATVTVTVTAVNDAPVAIDDTFSTLEDAPLSGDVSVNDGDVDSPTLSYTVAADVTSGVLILNTDGSFGYTPGADFTGADQFTYTVSDGVLTDTATASITVTPANDAPVAIDDAFTVAEEMLLSGDVSANDSDADSPALTYTLLADATNGVLALNTDGSFDYTPVLDFTGADQFTYTVSDGLLTDTATASITVTPINDAPAAVDDAFTTAESTLLSGDVSANDSDADSPALTYTLLADASNGALVLNTDGSFDYTPGVDFSGADQFTYTVSDGLLTDTATVSITVTPENDAPIAVDDAFTTAEETLLSGDVSVNDSDVDSPTLTFELLADASNGALVLNTDGSFDYTPGVDFAGADQFTYTVSDGLLTDTATVSITVTPENDAPVAEDDAFTIVEDALLSGDVSLNDGDIDNANLTYTLLADVANGALTFIADGAFSFRPDADFFGGDQFTYTVSDGVLTDTATASITVTPENDAPSATDVFATGAEDVAVSGILAGADVDGDVLTYSVSVGPANGSVEIGAGGAFTYAPDANFNGVDSFTYVAEDPSGEAASAQAVITINPVGDAPVASDDFYTVLEDGVLMVPAATGVLANDTDIDLEGPLTSTLSTGPQNGAVALQANGAFTYTPTADFNGADSFTYLLSDGDQSVEATVSIVVTAVNDAPEIADAAFTGDEDTIISGALAADDADNQPLVFSLVGGAANGDVSVAANGAFDYAPNADFTGVDAFQVQVSDGELTDVATVMVTVQPANDGPVADPATAIGDENTILSGVLTAMDIDTPTLVFSLQTGAANGDVSVDANGAFTYTPDENFFGADSFVFAVTDGLETDTATISLTVNSVNDAPVIDDATFVGDEDTIISGVLAASDADGDALTVSLAAEASNGVASVNPDGSFTYTPNAGFSGADSFQVRVSDGVLDDVGTVSLTVNPLNEAPTATNDTATTLEGQQIVIPVLANDVDPDEDPLMVTQIGAVANGVAAINPDGSITYTPDPDFGGVEAFTYTISDGELTALGTVSVTVEAVNEAPLAADVQVAGVEDTEISGAVTATDPDGDVLSFSLSRGPANGQVVVDAMGGFSYSPDGDFSGEDSFDVEVSDGQLSATSTVAVTVTPANDAPEADDQSIRGPQGGVIPGQVVATDADGDVLLYMVSANAANGDVTVFEDGAFTYAPDAGFSGTDSFAIQVSDGVATDVATIDVTVDAVGVTITIAAIGEPVLDSAGDLIAYEVVATNTGAAAIEDLAISDELTGFFTTISLAAGASTTLTTPAYAVTNEDLNTNGGGDGELNNTVTARSLLLDAPATAATATPLEANGAPVFTSPVAATVAENQSSVLTLQAADDRSVADLTFTIDTAAGDGAFFSLGETNGVLTFTAPPDFETPVDQNGDNLYTLTVVATDAGGLFAAQELSVTVEDIPAIFSIEALDDNTLDETGDTEASFRVQRDGDLSGAIDLTLDLGFGPGLEQTDFALSGDGVSQSNGVATVSFADGQTEAILTVTAQDDREAEGDETLSVTIAPDPAYDVGAMSEVQATIAANDFVVTSLADSGEGTLRQAIENANATPGLNVITFDIPVVPPVASAVAVTNADDVAVIHLQSTINVTDAVVINAASSGRPIVISGDAAGDDVTTNGITDVAQTTDAALSNNIRLFDLDEPDAATEFAGVTLTGGVARNTGNFVTGGGVLFAEADVTFTDSVVAGNAALGPKVSGGAIFSVDADVTISNSTFSGNFATGQGGAVHNRFGDINVVGSTFENNVVEGPDAEGAALRNYQGAINVSASTFNANQARGVSGASEHVEAAGGAIRNAEGAINVDRSTFNGNSASVVNQSTSGAVDVEGGAIRSSSGAITVTNSSFVNNSVSASGVSSPFFVEIQGGAIRSNEGDVTISDSTFSGNTATGADAEGGAIMLEEAVSQLTITSSSITGNSATGSGAKGGGVFVGGAATIADSAVSGNSATVASTANIGLDAGAPAVATTSAGAAGPAAFSPPSAASAAFVATNGAGDKGGETLANVIRGGKHDDRLISGSGDEMLYGGDGHDVLVGGAGNDVLVGGSGDDVIYGEDGNDRLFGEAGNDLLAGGSGADIFVFAETSGSNVVTDFTPGLDKIDLVSHGIGFADLTIRTESGDAIISYKGLEVRLEGVASAALNEDDFVL